ncbi:glycosyltransferase [Balneola sp. MJW-20]|uniref:glycosyltransferase n=1 Tax=Gracilimonas aurantiaca TaxID=3234185 RepID=UPI0034674112
MGEKADISIIIVNYKVKEYIANLLNSIAKANEGLLLEIFVVDNNSGDDSIKYLRSRFPEVHYIQNEENVGFGKANNQAIRKAKGQYTLIINPDTLVSEDTLGVMKEHMDNNPDCAAAGCKIMNPDGTFAPESRRSVPGIWSAACKVFGLNAIFPKSKIFARYYLSWMDEDTPSEIPVLSGSFMFWRTSVLKDLDGFDERFFMYGEDIDLCYRVQETEFHIDYVPDTSIIHYKGESTQKEDLRYIRLFNKALYQFFEKQYSTRYSFIFRILIFLAVKFKTFTSFLSTKVRQSGLVFSDLLILNISLFIAFAMRFGFDMEQVLLPKNLDFLWINLLLSLLYLFTAGIAGVFRNQDSLSAHMKAIIFAYSAVVLITYFARDLAFSRFILGFGFLFGIIGTVAFRLIRANTGRNNGASGRLRGSRVIIVGDAAVSKELTDKIHSRPDWNYEVIGQIRVEQDHTEEDPQGEVMGTLSQLTDLAKAYKADEIFFALKSISYKSMLNQISSLQGEGISFKLIPDSMDFILGKSKVEYLEAIPLVEVELAINKPFNKFLKRALDLLISFPVFLVLLLLTFPSVLFSRTSLKKHGSYDFYKPVKDHKWKNRLRLMGYVLSGKMSLVGAEIGYGQLLNRTEGITGPVQLSNNRIRNQEDKESFDLYYQQNYSIWVDIDLIFRSLFSDYSVLQILSRES